jgi:hypothetical protein
MSCHTHPSEHRRATPKQNSSPLEAGQAGQGRPPKFWKYLVALPVIFLLACGTGSLARPPARPATPTSEALIVAFAATVVYYPTPPALTASPVVTTSTPSPTPSPLPTDTPQPTLTPTPTVTPAPPSPTLPPPSPTAENLGVITVGPGDYPVPTGYPDRRCRRASPEYCRSCRQHGAFDQHCRCLPGRYPAGELQPRYI